MPPWMEMICCIGLGILSSSGLWAYILARREKTNIRNKILLGLAHDRIIELCNKYIKRKYITTDEYENLHDYLYAPYRSDGGNGAAERLFIEVNKLPIKNEGDKK